jgi:hypothetical protein
MHSEVHASQGPVAPLDETPSIENNAKEENVMMNSIRIPLDQNG